MHVVSLVKHRQLQGAVRGFQCRVHPVHAVVGRQQQERRRVVSQEPLELLLFRVLGTSRYAPQPGRVLAPGVVVRGGDDAHAAERLRAQPLLFDCFGEVVVHELLQNHQGREHIRAAPPRCVACFQAFQTPQRLGLVGA